ncbi:MAG: SlyX family protein [Planctomycetales bacterium]|nr:SlyX family protein [Planctomycetales bacterium]
MTTAQYEERLRRLEEVATHQDHLLQQLNEVIVLLRKEHDDLKVRLVRQLERLETTIESNANPLDPNERPPHY